MSVRYHVITADELDASLVLAWRSAQRAVPHFESPFFCPEFTRLVAAVRDDVRIVVVEEDGRPVAFFPHQRGTWAQGKAVGGAFSDYHGVIAPSRGEWCVPDLLRAARLAVWSFDHLVDPFGKFDSYVTARDRSPQIDISGGLEAYLKRIGGAPSEFARKARKMEREVGALTFTLHDPRPLDLLLRWKSDQFRSVGAADAFARRWTVDLLHNVMNVQTAEFAGVCSVLRAGDRVIAVHAGMRSRAMLHWWFPKYEEEFAKYSPGIILLMRIAEAIAPAGVRTIDLGKGEARYKRSVMTGEAELKVGCVELPSLRTQARRLRRAAEAFAAGGGVGGTLRLPLRALRRIERQRMFH
jgi:CelD/BcsL family acetyltransferase involved in cellulose biosynthesis